jgi:hypothetical protein
MIEELTIKDNKINDSSISLCDKCGELYKNFYHKCKVGYKKDPAD